MAVLTNPSFETAGVSLGKADSWTEAQTDAAEEVGQFYALGYALPFEDFENGWQQNEGSLTELIAAYLTVGLFATGSLREDYEFSWVLPNPVLAPTVWNHQSLGYLSTDNLTVGMFNVGLLDAEAYEESWSDNQDSMTLNSMTVTAGVFTGGEEYEDYEEGWLDNDESKTLSTWNPAPSGTFVTTDDLEDYEPDDGATWSVLD